MNLINCEHIDSIVTSQTHVWLEHNDDEHAEEYYLWAAIYLIAHEKNAALIKWVFIRLDKSKCYRSRLILCVYTASSTCGTHRVWLHRRTHG